MFNSFYIIKDGWFQLLLKDSHYCVSCGDYEDILAALGRYVRKYKTPDRLERAIAKINYGKGAIVDDSVIEQRKGLLVAESFKYEDDIRRVIEEAFTEVRGEGLVKYKKTQEKLSKSKGVLLNKVVKETPDEKPVEKLQVESCLKVLGKPKVLLRKLTQTL